MATVAFVLATCVEAHAAAFILSGVWLLTVLVLAMALALGGHALAWFPGMLCWFSVGDLLVFPLGLTLSCTVALPIAHVPAAVGPVDQSGLVGLASICCHCLCLWPGVGAYRLGFCATCVHCLCVVTYGHLAGTGGGHKPAGCHIPSYHCGLLVYCVMSS